MYTTHGHWFPPAVDGEHRLPAAQCGGVQGCVQCASECTRDVLPDLPGGMLGVLNLPAPTAPSLPSKSAPLQVPIDSVRDWYQRFLELKDAESKIKDMLAEARGTILDLVKSQFEALPVKTDFTIDGRPVLQRHVVTQNRVDTTRLKAERPDIHAQFVRPLEQEHLKIL